MPRCYPCEHDLWAPPCNQLPVLNPGATSTLSAGCLGLETRVSCCVQGRVVHGPLPCYTQSHPALQVSSRSELARRESLCEHGPAAPSSERPTNILMDTPMHSIIKYGWLIVGSRSAYGRKKLAHPAVPCLGHDGSVLQHQPPVDFPACTGYVN